MYAPTLDMLDPVQCVGYNNIFVHCGINDLKQPGSDSKDCVNKLIATVDKIKHLCL